MGLFNKLFKKNEAAQTPASAPAPVSAQTPASAPTSAQESLCPNKDTIMGFALLHTAELSEDELTGAIKEEFGPETELEVSRDKLFSVIVSREEAQFICTLMPFAVPDHEVEKLFPFHSLSPEAELEMGRHQAFLIIAGNGFELENYKGKELVIIGGGTGVSPMRGVIQYFSAHPEEAVSTTLIAGFKSPEDVLFKKDFEEWKKTFHVIQTVDAAPEGYEGPIGMVTKYIPDLRFKNPENAVFICVGPPVMIKFTIMEIKKLGIKDEQIWTSYERKMCCGIGKCGHCRMNEKYVCLDGPVFNYTEARELID